MLIDAVSLKDILTSMEAVLEIEYSDISATETVDQALKRLESSYNIDIKGDIYSTMAANKLIADDVNRLLSKITQCLKDLSYYLLLISHNKSVPICLGDVNYLGVGRAALNTALQYLQDVDYCKAHGDDTIASLSKAVDQVQICYITRLCICMFVLYRLGITDGAGIVARLLYLGGLVL